MIKFYLILIIFLSSLSLKSQNNYGPRLTAMGNAGVAMQDIWSVQKNQAGIAALKNAQFSAGYENRFGVKELNTQSAAFVLPIKNYAIGANFQSYGVNAYRESKSGISLAKSFGPKLLAAVNLNYHQIKIDNYGNAQGFSVEVGLQYQAFDNLWLGTHIANPNQSKYGTNTEQIIPAHLQFGAAYKFSNQLMISGEVEKILDGQVNFKTGLEYKVVNFVALRGGIALNPFKQYAGFGVNYEKIQVDFAIASHPVLGYSPQVSIGYEF
jgi:hypothetical protein